MLFGEAPLMPPKTEATENIFKKNQFNPLYQMFYLFTSIKQLSARDAKERAPISSTGGSTSGLSKQHWLP